MTREPHRIRAGDHRHARRSGSDDVDEGVDLDSPTQDDQQQQQLVKQQPQQQQQQQQQQQLQRPLVQQVGTSSSSLEKLEALGGEGAGNEGRKSEPPSTSVSRENSAEIPESSPASAPDGGNGAAQADGAPGAGEGGEKPRSRTEIVRETGNCKSVQVGGFLGPMREKKKKQRKMGPR